MIRSLTHSGFHFVVVKLMIVIIILKFPVCMNCCISAKLLAALKATVTKII